MLSMFLDNLLLHSDVEETQNLRSFFFFKKMISEDSDPNMLEQWKH